MYRDDDEAARARADALQRDLDDTQDELAKARAKLAAVEAEKARLAAKLASAPARSTSDEPEPATAGVPGRGPGAALGLILTIGFVLFMWVVFVRRDRAGSDPPNPTCTLRTDPTGADVRQLCERGYENYVGTTPISLPRLEWLAKDVTCRGPYLIRLAGYEEMQVSSPLEGLGCDDQVIQLGATTAAP